MTDTPKPNLPELVKAATPGPWFREGPDMFGDHNILHPADSLAIAAAVSNLRPSREVQANADLLALAPTLAALVLEARTALRPFADLRMPAKCEGNAAAYSILHSEILAARTTLAKLGDL